MIKLIISDMDGVIFEGKQIHFEALNQALEKIGPEFVINQEEHLTTYDGLPTMTKLKMLNKLKGLPDRYYEQINSDKQKNTLTLLDQKISTDQNLISVFKKLKEDGYTIYVASNSIKDTIERFCRRAGIYPLIDWFISNEDVKFPKPHPEMYMRAMVLAGYGPDETLILEDSPKGREAAERSKAHLFPVESTHDVTYKAISAEIHALERKTVSKSGIKWKSNKLNIVIPMAGAGSRFEKAGYTFPKPLITTVENKSMIQLVVECLNIDAHYTFIVQREHNQKYKYTSMLNMIAPGCDIIETDGLTQGAACTVLLAKDIINTERQLLIANSDQYIEWNPSEFFYQMIEEKLDGGILTFYANHPKWSYADVDGHGYVKRVAEKEVISEHATCFSYHTTVLTENGSETIGKLVNQKTSVKILSFNESMSKFEFKPILDWIKIKKQTPWYQISFEDAEHSRRREKKSPLVTGDHRVLTKRGWKRVDALSSDDMIATRYFDLSEKQCYLLDGILLGDAFLQKPNTTGEKGRLNIKHCFKQKEWFDISVRAMHPFPFRLDVENPGMKKSGSRMMMQNGSYRASFAAAPVWKAQRQRWYNGEGVKQIPGDINLNDLSLAAWYMDDGSLRSTGTSAVLCTECFDEKSIQCIRDKLLDIGITTNKFRKNKGFGLHISNGHRRKRHRSADKFFEMIASFLPPSMQYKLPITFRSKFDIKQWDDCHTGSIFYSPVIVNKADPTRKGYDDDNSYCLTIADNHNMIVSDMVVSNCGIYYWAKGSDFVRYAEQMIAKDIRVSGEFYTCPVYNEAIADGRRIKIANVDRMTGVGTPEDLEAFQREYNALYRTPS